MNSFRYAGLKLDVILPLQFKIQTPAQLGSDPCMPWHGMARYNGMSYFGLRLTYFIYDDTHCAGTPVDTRGFENLQDV